MTSTAEHLAIRARGLTVRYGRTTALDAFSLDVWTGGLLTIVGPSGCGKTTALRVMAGFEHPDAGSVEVRGRTVVDETTFVPPERRRIGMVFQDYALFPHMTVEANVAYGLSDPDDARIPEILGLVGLRGFEGRLPSELSGGQRQRVALARAMAPKPDVLFLDEPFSNLDAALRQHVRQEVRQILAETETTAVFVTHDQEEALAMSDMVAVMRAGRVVQAAGPDEVYLAPADAWVAGFLGDADFVPGHASGGRVVTPFGTFGTGHDGRVTVMVRPEAVKLVPDDDGDAVVTDRQFFGHDQMVTVEMPGGSVLRSRLGPTPMLIPGDRVWVEVEAAVAYPA